MDSALTWQARQGRARLGLARSGAAWKGRAGWVRQGSARHGRAGFGRVWQAWHGSARSGAAWQAGMNRVDTNERISTYGQDGYVSFGFERFDYCNC